MCGEQAEATGVVWLIWCRPAQPAGTACQSRTEVLPSLLSQQYTCFHAVLTGQ